MADNADIYRRIFRNQLGADRWRSPDRRRAVRDRILEKLTAVAAEDAAFDLAGHAAVLEMEFAKLEADPAGYMDAEPSPASAGVDGAPPEAAPFLPDASEIRPGAIDAPAPSLAPVRAETVVPRNAHPAPAAGRRRSGGARARRVAGLHLRSRRQALQRYGLGEDRQRQHAHGALQPFPRRAAGADRRMVQSVASGSPAYALQYRWSVFRKRQSDQHLFGFIERRFDVFAGVPLRGFWDGAKQNWTLHRDGYVRIVVSR